MSIDTKNILFHSSDSRGLADHGWLKSRHTFSFAGYHNPDRMHFGALRVLNDDIVAPGKGFGTHPHDNMEIISIPIRGSLAHKDSIGREKEIKTGEVQIMSAGSGLSHSEYNYSDTEEVNFIQIWILPKERNIRPRYDQKDFSELLKKNELVTVVSPDSDDALWINQDSVLTLGNLDAGTSLTHQPNFENSGLYSFLIEGEVKINETILHKRDAIGLFDKGELNIDIAKNSELLIIEVPSIY